MKINNKSKATKNNEATDAISNILYAKKARES